MQTMYNYETVHNLPVTVAYDNPYAPFLADDGDDDGPGTRVDSFRSGSSVALSISNKAFIKSQLWTNGLVPDSIALMRAASMLRPGSKSPAPAGTKSSMAATTGSAAGSRRLSKMDSVVFAKNSGTQLTGVQQFLLKAGSMFRGPSVRVPRGPSGRMLLPQVSRNRIQLRFMTDMQVWGVGCCRFSTGHEFPSPRGREFGMA